MVRPDFLFARAGRGVRDTRFKHPDRISGRWPNLMMKRWKTPCREVKKRVTAHSIAAIIARIDGNRVSPLPGRFESALQTVVAPRVPEATQGYRDVGVPSPAFNDQAWVANGQIKEIGYFLTCRARGDKVTSLCVGDMREQPLPRTDRLQVLTRNVWCNLNVDYSLLKLKRPII